MYMGNVSSMKHIAKILLFTITSLNLSIPCHAEDTNTYNIEQFFTYYYLHPSPNNLPIVLSDFLESDVLSEESFDEHTEYLTAYFFARASKSEPEILENYKIIFEFGTHKQRLFVLKLLQFCGNEDIKKFLTIKMHAERFSNERKQIEQALKEGIPIDFTPLAAPIETAGDLNFLWTEFTATGNEEAIIKIINALGFNNSSTNLKLVSGAAKWSLSSHCIVHEKVLEICKEELSNVGSQVKKTLHRIIDEVEIFKTLVEIANNQGGSVSNLPRGKQEIAAGTKAWALGCSAVVVEYNHSRHDLLGMEEYTPSKAEKSRTSLCTSCWDINNREDLFSNMIQINIGGHRKIFEQISLSFMSLNEADRLAVLEMYKANDVNTPQILFVEKQHKNVGEEGILAWDYSRIIFLCRWGYKSGYINEQEAWTILIKIAKMLQKQFDSWEELGRNYIIGRKFRFYEEMQNEAYLYEDAYQRLLDMSSSPWNLYSWNMNLSEM